MTTFRHGRTHIDRPYPPLAITADAVIGDQVLQDPKLGLHPTFVHDQTRKAYEVDTDPQGMPEVTEEELDAWTKEWDRLYPNFNSENDMDAAMQPGFWRRYFINAVLRRGKHG